MRAEPKIDPTLLGRPDATDSGRGMEEDLTRLKKELKDAGWLEARPRQAALQGIGAAALMAGAFAALAIGPWGWALSVALMGLYYCQAAYISHDAAHGQIVRGRKELGTLFSALSLAHGLSMSWWHRKHSAHHAAPNAYKMVGGRMCPVDGDIDTLPFISWDPRLLSPPSNPSRAVLFWTRLQPCGAWALFCVLRLNWIYAGLRHGSGKERLLIVGHQAVMLMAASVSMGSGMASALGWLVAVNLLAGLTLSCFFLFGHTGMDIYEQAEAGSHWDAQLRSTRNFSANRLSTWASGGLNHQIEHHLFPSMPRALLPKAAPLVRAIVEGHGRAYPVATLAQGLGHVQKALRAGSRPCAELAVK